MRQASWDCQAFQKCMGVEAQYARIRRCIPTEVEEGCGPEPQGELGALLSGQDSDMLFAQELACAFRACL